MSSRHGLVPLAPWSDVSGADADVDLMRVLADVADEPDVVRAMHRAEELRYQACRAAVRDAVVRELDRAIDGDHDLVAVAALHALSAVAGPDAGTVLTTRLHDHRRFVREHAAWALSARAPELSALPALLAMVERADFGAMLAQRTLAGWSTHRAVAQRVVEQLARRPVSVPAVDLLGLIDDDAATAELERLATIDGPGAWAAVGALGERDSDAAVLMRLARRDDAVGAAARLALLDRARRSRAPMTAPAGGLRVAQVVLHADLSALDDAAGRGDNGGLATLVRQLGDAFARRPDMGGVTTLTRGSVEQAIGDVLTAPTTTRRIAPIALERPEHVDRRTGWIQRIAVERGVRRALLAGPLPDLLHLRMADVGTLAAQRVARQLGVPVVFTAAPDPHQPLRQACQRGEIDPASFGALDESEHHWFRARLVERLSVDATAVVTLPRPGGAAAIGDLLGGDAGAVVARAPAVGEGIDPTPLRAARRRARDAAADGSHPLARLVERGLAPDRHGLPLVVSVGRLHPVKGLATLARAWRDDPELAATTNLVIVGGDFDDPSPDERDVIAELTALLGDASRRAERGALLAGHLGSRDVADVLAGAHLGVDAVVGRGGIYVAAAPKEEFGLAIVEALGAGLTVVAPHVGGPATYLDDGVTGVLTDTTSTTALARAMHHARALVDRPGRVAAADALIDDRLSIDAMADGLIEVYRSVLVPA